MSDKMWLDLPYLFGFSFFGFCSTMYLIPKCADMFLKKGISGTDMGKRTQRRIPESGGVISGCVFLMVTFLMIPVSFWHDYGAEDFPHSQFVQLLAALLSITCMLLLGFADDVLDLRWRHKLILPLFASLPLLMVYYVSHNVTDIVVPITLRPFLGGKIGKNLFIFIILHPRFLDFNFYRQINSLFIFIVLTSFSLNVNFNFSHQIISLTSFSLNFSCV